MRYPAGAGDTGGAAVDLPDTPQGGARRMRWLHLSSIILGILCIGMMGSVQWGISFCQYSICRFLPCYRRSFPFSPESACRSSPSAPARGK